jgi:hypothetical protein
LERSVSVSEQNADIVAERVHNRQVGLAVAVEVCRDHASVVPGRGKIDRCLERPVTIAEKGR